MKKTKLTLLLICFTALNSMSQLHYKSANNGTEMYYENTIEFNGKKQQELITLVEKYLKINQFRIHHKDESSIYALGKFPTRYRRWFLIFFGTEDYNCIYDLEIMVKDGKIKYKATDYVLLAKNISASTLNWGYGISTTKIPSDIPTKPVNTHFKYGNNHKKTKKKYLLFQSIDKYMLNFEKEIKQLIKEEKDENW